MEQIDMVKIKREREATVKEEEEEELQSKTGGSAVHDLGMCVPRKKKNTNMSACFRGDGVHDDDGILQVCQKSLQRP